VSTPQGVRITTSTSKSSCGRCCAVYRSRMRATRASFPASRSSGPMCSWRRRSRPRARRRRPTATCCSDYKASLSTDSFISAAFVPGDDARSHRGRDHGQEGRLRGLKENVIAVVSSGRHRDGVSQRRKTAPVQSLFRGAAQSAPETETQPERVGPGGAEALKKARASGLFSWNQSDRQQGVMMNAQLERTDRPYRRSAWAAWA